MPDPNQMESALIAWREVETDEFVLIDACVHPAVLALPDLGLLRAKAGGHNHDGH
jgi:hypothetical protein